MKDRNKEAYNQLKCKFENTQVTTGYWNAQATQKPKPGHAIAEKYKRKRKSGIQTSQQLARPQQQLVSSYLGITSYPNEAS